MANTFLNAKEYANVFMLLLKNQLVYAKLISSKFENKTTDENGLTIYVKKPPQFIAKDGATLAEQAIATGETSLSINRYRNVHIGLSDLEAVTNWNDLMKNETMKSAASTLAHDVDLYIAQQTKYFPNHVGANYGAAIATHQQAMKAHTRLMDLSVPNDGSINGIVTFEDAELIRGGLTATNIDGTNKIALERVRIPMISEINWFASSHVPTITAGTRAASGAAQVDGASQNVNYVSVKDADYATINVKNLTAAHTVKAGEIFTIANVLAYDNRGQQTLTFNRQFVVWEDRTADGSGLIANLKYFPPIIVPGTGSGEADTNTAFGTVDAAPANSAAITFLGTASTGYRQRAVFHKSAIQMVSAKLQAPYSDTYSFATDKETGISIRYWRGSDIATGRHVHRFDMIYGVKNIDPRLGTRLSGTTP